MAHLDGAGVSLGGKPVLRDVDLTLARGEVIGISGPNGSGKTTLARALATLIRVDRGGGAVLGADINTDAVFEVRHRIGMIGHVPALLSELTLKENLIHVSRLAGIELSRVDQMLEVVGLAEAADRMTEASSFGMKRRIEVAHLLLRKPTLLLLDEAMSGLDASAQDLIGALVDRTTGDGGAAVMVSHDPAHLAEMCPTVLELSTGTLKVAS